MLSRLLILHRFFFAHRQISSNTHLVYYQNIRSWILRNTDDLVKMKMLQTPMDMHEVSFLYVLINFKSVLGQPRHWNINGTQTILVV